MCRRISAPHAVRNAISSMSAVTFQSATLLKESIPDCERCVLRVTIRCQQDEKAAYKYGNRNACRLERRAINQLYRIVDRIYLSGRLLEHAVVEVVSLHYFNFNILKT